MNLLRQVAKNMGLDPDAVEAVASVRQRRIGRSKAREEISYRDPKIQEEFRKQQILRESQRLSRAESPLQLSSVLVSPTRSIVALRNGDEVTIWQLRLGVAKRRPRTRKVHAQLLPAQKVYSVSVEKVIVSTPEKTSVLVTSGRQRSVPLPESERKAIFNTPSEWFLRLENGNHVVVLEGSISEVREKLKRIKKLPISQRLLLSSDLKRWIQLSEVFLP